MHSANIVVAIGSARLLCMIHFVAVCVAVSFNIFRYADADGHGAHRDRADSRHLSFTIKL